MLTRPNIRSFVIVKELFFFL